MPTAADLINRSLRLLGALAEGETPSADSAQDALATLNDMLDSWSLESLTVFSTNTQSIEWPVGQASASLGPTGTLGPLVRPILLSDNTFYSADGMDYPLTMLTEADYNGIVAKDSRSSFPHSLYVDADYPDATLTLYPVPTRPITLRIVSRTPFAALTELTDELSLPPGYARAIRFNLAVELFPEFGITPELNSNVLRTALISKRNLQRINGPSDTLSLPAGFPTAGGRFNIFTGD